MRPRVLRRRLALAWFGAILAGLALGFSAPNAHAAATIERTDDGGMSLMQFIGYLAAELILVGALIFAVVLAAYWVIDRRPNR